MLKCTINKGKMVVKSFKRKGPRVSKVNIAKKDSMVRKDFTKKVRKYY